MEPARSWEWDPVNERWRRWSQSRQRWVFDYSPPHSGPEVSRSAGYYPHTNIDAGVTSTYPLPFARSRYSPPPIAQVDTNNDPYRSLSLTSPRHIVPQTPWAPAYDRNPPSTRFTPYPPPGLRQADDTYLDSFTYTHPGAILRENKHYETGQVVETSTHNLYLVLKQSGSRLHVLPILDYRHCHGASCSIIYSGHKVPAPYPGERTDVPAIRVVLFATHKLSEHARLDLTAVVHIIVFDVHAGVGVVHDNSRFDFDENFGERWCDTSRSELSGQRPTANQSREQESKLKEGLSNELESAPHSVALTESTVATSSNPLRAQPEKSIPKSKPREKSPFGLEKKEYRAKHEYLSLSEEVDKRIRQRELGNKDTGKELQAQWEQFLAAERREKEMREEELRKEDKREKDKREKEMPEMEMREKEMLAAERREKEIREKILHEKTSHSAQPTVSPSRPGSENISKDVITEEDFTALQSARKHKKSSYAKQARTEPPQHAQETTRTAFTPELHDCWQDKNPAAYFRELHSLESQVVNLSYLRFIFPSSAVKGSVHMSRACTDSLSRRDEASHVLRDMNCESVLRGVMDSLRVLESAGFSGKSINILRSVSRQEVVEVIDIEQTRVQALVTAVASIDSTLPYDESPLRVEVDTMLEEIFQVSISWETSTPAACLPLLCSLLALAVVSYAGSHCIDLCHNIWDSKTVESFRFEGSKCAVGASPYSFSRRRLKCLDEYIGGPVWVFGAKNASRAWLSTSIIQFASLWGPLFALPHKQNFDSLIALQSERGVLYRTPDSQQKGKSKEPLWSNEVLMHWLPCTAPRKRRSGIKLLSEMIMSSRSEKLPKHLAPFDANARLLIGWPPSDTIHTVTAAAPRLAITLLQDPQIKAYGNCKLNLATFRAENRSRFHRLGTYKDFYVPEQFQLAFSGGQYVNVGFQKVWKRKQGQSFKSVLLMELSNPRISRNAARQRLRYRVGLEYSVCTKNARRVSLQDALCTANWAYEAEILDACNTGNIEFVLDDITELAQCGHTEDGRFLALWPYEDNTTLELLSSVHHWLDVLRETEDNACFAVATGTCLGYQGSDDVARTLLRQQCSKIAQRGVTTRKQSSVLQTTLDLDPAGQWHLPLDLKQKFDVGNGQVEVLNCNNTAQLLRYTRHNVLSTLARSVRPRPGLDNRELVDTDRPVMHSVRVCIVD